jgi:hypothetical protein
VPSARDSESERNSQRKANSSMRIPDKTGVKSAKDKALIENKARRGTGEFSRIIWKGQPGCA